MIRPLTCALALALTAGPVVAQVLTTNAQGQRVIVYPDGRTQLFDAPESAEPQDAPDVTPTAPPSPTAAGARVPTPEEEADAVLEVRRQIARLSEELEVLTKLAKRARGREGKIANRVRKLRDSDRIDDRSQVEIVSQQLVAAREESRAAEEARASTEERAAALRRTLEMSIAERTAFLDGLGFGYLIAAPSPAGDAEPAAGLASGTPTSASRAPDQLATDAEAATPAAFASYDRAGDTRYAPPAQGCSRALDTVDEFTGKRRIALAPEVLFTYTSPELKPFLKSESLITCEAYLTRTGRTTVLETVFTIRSQFASKEFGVLPKGSQMTFKTVDGQRLTLKNQRQSQPDYDPVEKVSTYRGRYPLSRSARKALADALLDEVRVMWGTGFDDYALYDLTFLQRQLECLENS